MDGGCWQPAVPRTAEEASESSVEPKVRATSEVFIQAMIPTAPFDHLHAIELPTPFPVGPITVYLADAPGEPLTLVDTGPRTDAARIALEDGLATLGHALSDLACIIVTHAHVDHFGLAADLVAASGAGVWTHGWNLPPLMDYEADRRRRNAFYVKLLQQAAVPSEIMAAIGLATAGMHRYARPVAVDRPLNEGDRLRLAGRDWQVLHTPGHAAGLTCLYEPASQTLLSSDHLLAAISSNPIVEPPQPGQTERPRSLHLYQAALRRVAALGVRLALPSHGPAITDVSGLIARRLAFHQQRMARVVDALRGGARTTWEVTLTLFPNLSPLNTFLAVSEVIGHLDLLEVEGMVSTQAVDGHVEWRLLEE
jgi:glyoxylase-like metal-dependent hydrolase (beta-lactamase superfamily II)